MDQNDKILDDIARGLVLVSLNKNPSSRVGNDDIDRAFESLYYAGYRLRFEGPPEVK